MKKQVTINTDVKVEGLNVYNGRKNAAIFHPAKENSGLVFLVNKVKVPAKLEFAEYGGKAIVLDNGKEKVKLVEHLLSAVYALGIDNLEIELTDKISPTTTNCSFNYFDALKNIREEQVAQKKFWTYDANIKYKISAIDIFPKNNGRHDSLTVSRNEEEFVVDYEAFYPHKVVGSQKYRFKVDEQDYEKNIAMARPPGFLGDELCKNIFIMLGKLGLHGINYENYICITSKNAIKYANPEHLGVRFEGKEFVRRKISDVMGTLALTGRQFANTEFKFYMTGHEFDLGSLKKMFRAGCFVDYAMK
jgi:UDP-3-O-[3-hydroxymyristoyl] N-acetylglucosamine deacetylase